MISLINTPQLLFWIIVPTTVLIIVAILVSIPLSNKYCKTNYRNIYYKKIYKVALYNDYYLLNDFIFKIDASHAATIDHILFADKFIYLFTSLYYEGDITGKDTSQSLILIPHKSKRAYVDNPILQAEKLMTTLSRVTNIPTSMLVGVIVVNNGCNVNVVFDEKKDIFMIKEKDISKLVGKVESTDIEPINAEELDRAVKVINKLNRRKRITNG